MPGWETPYGTVSRAGDRSYWQAMAQRRPPLAYGQPPVTVDRGQYPTYQQTPWDPQPRPMPAPVSGDALPINASMPLGTRTAQIGTPWVAPGTPVLPPTGAGAAPAGPWSPGLMAPAPTSPGLYDPTTGAYTGPRAPGAYLGGMSMRPPALGVAPGLIPAFTPGGAAPTAQAPPTGGGGGGAPAGTPATTGAFGPFGSIEDWRNQFYQEHGRWPTDTDAQDAIASFGFLGQTGRSPTQREWEDRWHGGYGGTTQWGPIGRGGGYGYGGGGGWAPPPEPSWWGGNVFGEEGWTYLPTGAGQYPYPKPERGTQTEAPWYNIKDIKTFQQVDPQWRDWLQQAMQSQQQHWEDPLMAPIQWMQPVASEL